jgi:uncharacterized protein (TIGR03118 family)
LKRRLCAEKSVGRGGSAAKQVPPQPGTALAHGLRAEAMTFSLYRRPALERRKIMLFSSWLRNRNRYAPAPRRRPPTSPRQRASFGPRLEALEDRLTPSTAFVQTNLVSDIPGLAQVTDANSVNAWGLAASPRGPFMVVNQGTGTGTVYNTSDPQVRVAPLVVDIPPNPADNPARAHGSPTGEVYNSDRTGFKVSANGKTGSSVFLFATADGTISGWSPRVDLTHAVIGATHAGGLYLGLAIATDCQGDTLLYAADFAHNTIDVYDQNFNLTTTLPGNFTDSQLPADYHAFNIQAIDNRLYVEYAPIDKILAGTADPGDGAVDVYNADGQLRQRLILPHDPHLNQPWAIALAPANFGSFSNDLLVGNFGDGHINAFNPHSGRFVGEMTDTSGQPVAITHLWAIAFGNGGAAGPTNTLYFTAGLTSHLAPGTGTPHGLFGSLQVARAADREAMTVNGCVPDAVSADSVGMSSSPSNFSSEQDQGMEALSVMSNAMTTDPASDMQARDQRIDAFISMLSADWMPWKR